MAVEVETVRKDSASQSASSEQRQGYGMMAPAAFILLAVAGYPVLSAFWLSLQRLVVIFHERRFIGLGNYAALVHDDRFWSALGNTAYFTLVTVPLELSLGLIFALLLNSGLPARGALRAAVLVPWAVPTVLSAKIWAWLFDPDSGPIGHFLSPQLNWLGTPGYAMHAAILVDVWKTTPFVALLLLGGLQTIPGHVYEAARVDGASRFRTFRAVTLPLLGPALLVAGLFRTLDAFRVFDSIYVLTEGGPANTTETLSIYAYKALMRSGDFGYGSALAVVTFVCVMSVSVLYLRLLGRGLEARA
jgi:multiple sugar transport system permease protein